MYVDFATTIELRLQRGARLVSKTTRKVPAGTVSIRLPVSGSQLRTGTFKVSVQAVAGTLKASRSFRVR